MNIKTFTDIFKEVYGDAIIDKLGGISESRLNRLGIESIYFDSIREAFHSIPRPITDEQIKKAYIPLKNTYLFDKDLEEMLK